MCSGSITNDSGSGEAGETLGKKKKLPTRIIILVLVAKQSYWMAQKQM